MTSYRPLSLILLFSLLWGCFPAFEQKQPVLVDVGKTELGYYNNHYFGFSLKVPEGWQFFEAAQLYPESERYAVKDVMVKDSVSQKAQLVKLGGIIKQVSETGEFLSSLQFQANYVGDFTIPEESTLSEQILQSYQEDFPDFQLQEAHRKPINGRFYYIWEGEVVRADANFQQAFYLLLTKDKTYGLSFILTYQGEKDEQLLSEMINNAFWRFRD